MRTDRFSLWFGERRPGVVPVVFGSVYSLSHTAHTPVHIPLPNCILKNWEKFLQSENSGLSWNIVITEQEPWDTAWTARGVSDTITYYKFTHIPEKIDYLQQNKLLILILLI